MPSRLKSLELQGYKTFASRTSFEFASSVTAIVGPNGSGKSNIADSLRWVLGEQSYVLLRGKKTEDMIFAGSEQRPRAGMASATIVFDNTDGWLPIDFSEVAITRRAYRDGENEYLLNGQRVRLRDVSELLSQSGLAERTYTIIGQGLVDAALALKAEERRRLFEEAAGIGLHRSRREEALKRLETTRRNLERVQDILAELQPRLRSLERQARRMQEYEQVKADLQLVLREWYGYHWHRAQQDLTEARESARAQESALDKIRNEQGGLDLQLSEAREYIQRLRAQLGDWHRQSASLHSRRETISRNLAVTGERLHSLEQQHQNTLDELSRQAEELALHQDRLKGATDEIDHLENERCEAQAQVELARKAMLARQAERAETERIVQASRQALSSLTARQSHLQARLAERQAQAERQVATLQKAAQAAAAGARELEAAQAQLETASTGRKQAQAVHRSAEEALQAQRVRSSELEATRKEALDRASVIGAEAARFKAQLDVLEQAEQALSGYANGARLLIQAARQFKLKGTRGALSSFLDVPAEFETAIAAGLGEFVDAVLLDGDTGLDDALNLLQGQAARAALLPMDSIRLNQVDAISSGKAGDGVLGLASTLIKAPEDLQPVVELLLGQVLVVQDRATARRVVSKAGSGLRAVTLQGEVFYAGGQILAGLDKKPGVLSRPRQRRELQTGLAEVDAQLQALLEHTRRIEASLSDQKTESERLAGEALQARKKVEAANNTYAQSELAVDKARRQHQWQREQYTRLETEIKSGEADTQKIEAELAPLEADIEKARQILRDQNAALSALSLEEFQAQLAHWNTRAAVAERAASEAHNRRREQQAALERLERARVGLQKRLETLKASAEDLEKEEVILRQDETHLNQQIEAIRVDIDPAEAELVTAERQQADLQVLEGSARQSLSQAEHFHAQAKIALARRQEALEGLRRRIEDDFGLVAFEYAQEISGPTPLPLDGMVEQLPRVEKLAPEVDETIKRQRGQLRRMGAINPEAQAEFVQVKERYEFLTDQVADLGKAEAGVKEVITELDLLMEREFRKTFDAVAQEFRVIFTRLFGGGTARLVLTDPEDLTSTGIDIEARLPGRRTQGLSLLSGGERSLTATALVFSLLKVSPTPFCVLDEVDAMLDEANVGRFRDLLRELSQSTQFVIVTHNRNTVQVADVIYGVTMGNDSASQVISLKLDEVASIVD